MTQFMLVIEERFVENNNIVFFNDVIIWFLLLLLSLLLSLYGNVHAGWEMRDDACMEITVRDVDSVVLFFLFFFFLCLITIELSYLLSWKWIAHDARIITKIRRLYGIINTILYDLYHNSCHPRSELAL